MSLREDIDELRERLDELEERVSELDEPAPSEPTLPGLGSVADKLEELRLAIGNLSTTQQGIAYQSYKADERRLHLAAETLEAAAQRLDRLGTLPRRIAAKLREWDVRSGDHGKFSTDHIRFMREEFSRMAEDIERMS